VSALEYNGSLDYKPIGQFNIIKVEQSLAGAGIGAHGDVSVLGLILSSSLAPHAPDVRLDALTRWLAPLGDAHGFDPTKLHAISGDASARRYFRVHGVEGVHGSWVVMDAPPPREDCRSFVHVAGLLRDADVNAPAIVAQDLAQGFLLLSDLGEHNYTQAIQQGLDDARLQTLYRQAIAALVRMQQAGTQGLPVCDQKHLLQELMLFPDWYVKQYYGVTLDAQERASMAQGFRQLVQDNLRQPAVLVHRDFHSPNLMVCTQSSHGENPGVIDFQDALVGPITYDLASLVTDARTTWEEEQQLDWAIRYWEAARAAGLPVPDDVTDFHRAYEWMGLQRNLRILGVFVRLAVRDGKPGYLAHLPRVLGYVRQVTTRYQAFRPLQRLLDRLQTLEPVVSASAADSATDGLEQVEP